MNLKLYLMHLAMVRNRKKVKKKPPYLGERVKVPRKGISDVEVYLYHPGNTTNGPLPVVFNVHGGAWVGGDATLLDTQSREMADRLSAFVVNINYRKLDEKKFPYAQQEICDTALYFAEHAQKYGLDKTRFTLMGYSAGGHLCAGAAMLLKDYGFPLNSQILCYPFLNFAGFDLVQLGEGDVKAAAKIQKLMHAMFFPKDMDGQHPLLSPVLATDQDLRGLAPVELIVCGEDALYPQAVAYRNRLCSAGIPVVLKQYEKSLHGFLEVNYPEAENNAAKNVEQEALMRECEAYIAQRLHVYWDCEDPKSSSTIQVMPPSSPTNPARLIS